MECHKRIIIIMEYERILETPSNLQRLHNIILLLLYVKFQTSMITCNVIIKLEYKINVLYTYSHGI